MDEPTTTWECEFRVTVTLEREGEDNDPSILESMTIEAGIKSALEAVGIDVDDWEVDDVRVESA